MQVEFRLERTIKFDQKRMINLLQNLPLSDDLLNLISLLDHSLLNDLHRIDLSV